MAYKIEPAKIDQQHTEIDRALHQTHTRHVTNCELCRQRVFNTGSNRALLLSPIDRRTNYVTK